MEDRERQVVAEEGIRFFGRMAASISHELTNSLAIINEHAGLLDDYTMSAQSGHPIDPARLRSVAGKIARQVQRAVDIVKSLNTFAHSTDETIADVDLAACVELVIALGGRLASRRGVGLEASTPGEPVPVRTAPFVLEQLLWCCLDLAVDVVGEGGTVAVKAGKRDGEARVEFTWPGRSTTVPPERLARREVVSLLELLRAGLRTDPDVGGLVLVLPWDIEHAERTGKEET